MMSKVAGFMRIGIHGPATGLQYTRLDYAPRSKWRLGPNHRILRQSCQCIVM